MRDHPYMLAAGLFTVLLFVAQGLVEDQGFDAVRWAALPLGLLALVLIFAPMFTLRRHGKPEPGKSYMGTTRVVDKGLFSLVRHPQYLGYIFLNLTFMAASQHWISLTLGSVAILSFYIHAVREERILIERFGDAYRRYMDRVPRFNVVPGTLRAIRRRRESPRTG